MAKITANGAHEVAAFNTTSLAGTEYRWVINSKGTVLRRWRGEVASGYTVFTKVGKDRADRGTLLAIIARQQHTLDE